MAVEQPVAVEHETLRRDVEELQREHDRLSRERPVDMRAHKTHRLKLQKNIAALRAHKARLGKL